MILPTDPPVRERTSLNADWRFCKSGAVKTPDPERPDFDDSGWRRLDLPHDWGIEGPFKQEYPGETGKLPWWGIAWYRKRFQFPAADSGRRVFVDFDGAMSHAEVWLNGQPLGGWPQ